jgi:tetratricopeptide (TPR) repeat protein
LVAAFSLLLALPAKAGSPRGKTTGLSTRRSSAEPAGGATGQGLFQAGTANEAIKSLPWLPEDYQKVVQLYVSGGRPGALATLGNWSEARLRGQIELFKDAVVTIRSCAACPARVVFAHFPVRAAILLHADREIQQYLVLPVSEQVSPCGTGPQATIIEHLAGILLLIDPGASDFLKPFYLGMARQAQWSHCFSESQDWAHAGLKRFPRDASLLMALAIATETGPFFTLGPAPTTLDAPPSVARQRVAAAVALRGEWESARRAFEDVIAVAPDLVEAHLRLGRILWRLGRPEAARASFETVLSRPVEASLRYLAHLFLGRVLEDGRQWSEAEQHYKTALSMQPRSETATVALSHVRFLQGDSESARAILREGLEAGRHRTEFDPWLPYHITQTPDGEAILAELRQAIRP